VLPALKWEDGRKRKKTLKNPLDERGAKEKKGKTKQIGSDG
jgi:hypothetical protein